ncbi:MAG: DUF4097 domain-containing protein [Spirochaetia bacterium]|nr:DUF4097 domain-containing protein [Spirochaetia bacterium]
MHTDRRFAAALVLILLSCSLFASGNREQLEKLAMKRIETSLMERLETDGDLQIQTAAASVIVTRDGTSGFVSAQLQGYAFDTVELKSSGSSADRTIHTEWRDHQSITAKDLQLRVNLPSQFSGGLRISTASGTVTLPEGTLQSLELTSSSGDVMIPKLVAHRMEISSSSGHITVRDVAVSELQIRNSSGNITVSARADREISATAVSGSITITGTAGEISAASTSGSVYIDLTQAGRQISAATVSGRIRIRIPKGTPSSGVMASVSGNRTVSLDQADVETTSNKTTFVRGTGESSFALASVSGNLLIEDSL